MRTGKLHIAVLLTSLFMFASSAVVSARIPDNVLKQKKAVVTIYINDKDGNQIATGSGFIIDSNGTIVTNYHVISKLTKEEGANSLLVKLENGAFYPLEKGIATDEDNDIALFKVDAKELPVVKLAKNYRPKQGESVVVIGSPFGLETTVSDGIISSVRGKEGIIQITAPISPGSSGSPVFNSKGEVIGIAMLLFQGGQNLNFAIPVKYVSNLLAEFRKPVEKPVPSEEESQEAKQLEETRRKAEELAKEVARLKKELEEGTKAKERDTNAETREVKEYNKTIKGLNAVKWFEKGVEAGDAGRYEEALGAFSNAIELKPDYQLAYVFRGLAYYAIGNHQKAIKEFAKAIELKPDDAKVYDARGSAYHTIGNYQQAIKDFTKAIELKPDDEYPYCERGRAYAAMGNSQQAIKDFTKAIILKPGYAEAYFNRGLTYIASSNDLNLRKNFQKAISDFTKAIEFKPDYAEAYYVRGKIYNTLSNHQQSINDFKIAARLGDKKAQDFLTKEGIQW